MMKYFSIALTIGLSVFSFLFARTSITFTFVNGHVSGYSTQFYEFDILAHAGEAGTQIGNNLVYINYNNKVFGSNIYSNGKITITKGDLIQGTFSTTDLQLYNIVNIADNTNSRVAITIDFPYDGSGFGNSLPTIPTQLLHICIEIQNASGAAKLSFQDSLMDGQQFESNNLINYDPVIISNIDNSLLSYSEIEQSIFHLLNRFQFYQN